MKASILDWATIRNSYRFSSAPHDMLKDAKFRMPDKAEPAEVVCVTPRHAGVFRKLNMSPRHGSNEMDAAVP